MYHLHVKWVKTVSNYSNCINRPHSRNSIQQKSLHLSLWKFKAHTYVFFNNTLNPFHYERHKYYRSSWRDIVESVFSRENCYSTFLYFLLQRYSDPSQAFHSFSFLRTLVWNSFAVCFELLSCYTYSSSARLLETGNYLVHENSWCNLRMSPPEHLLHSPKTSNCASLSGQCIQSLFQAKIRPNMLESIWAKQSSLGLMWLKNLLPIFKLLFMLYSKV